MQAESINEQIEQQLQMLESEDQEIKPYQICNNLAKYTEQIIDCEDTTAFKSCLQRMSHLYKRCKPNAIRVAIENVFIYSISTKIMLCPNRRELLDLLPQSFKQIITGQMTAAGI